MYWLDPAFDVASYFFNTFDDVGELLKEIAGVRIIERIAAIHPPTTADRLFHLRWNSDNMKRPEAK